MEATEATPPPPIRWGRIFGVLCLCVVIVEIFSRVFVYYWVGRPFDSFSKYRFSPYGLVRNNPRLTLPGFEHNANGFRNQRNFERVKPPNTLRVLILGGSTAYSGLASEMLADVERPGTDAVINRYLEDLLRASPDFTGLGIEVINASVPFNRGYELASAYIAEYAAWDADVVIVMGSGNNFIGPAPYADEIESHHYAMSAEHPWEADFERITNSRAVLPLVEHGLLFLEDNLASAALLRKFAGKFADRIVGLSNRYALNRLAKNRDRRVATFEEYNRYVDEVIGVQEALLVVARRHDQSVVFFWEYFLRHLDGIRPFPAHEAALYKILKRSTDSRDASYNFHARDRFAAFCKQEGVPFLDPIEVLRTDPTNIFIDYLHYTPDGNRVMAQFMFSQLEDLFRERARRIRAEQAP